MAQEADRLEEKFAAAVRVIQSLPEEGPFQPSDEMLLMFYGYHKQATSGVCNIPRPNGFWGSHDKAKWDAWSSLGSMSKEEAMRNYIEDIQLILETMPISEEVSDLVQKLGNFYSEVEEEVEAREKETDRRPFTRPLAGHADEQYKPRRMPTMEGFGDLWEDIQNQLPEQNKTHSGSGSCSLISSREGEDSKESSESERNKDARSGEENNGDDEGAAADGDKDEERDYWNPDSNLEYWNPWNSDLLRRRSDTKGSRSSVEPNMSSFTNGTHSSLNSKVEEEEPACSIERWSGCNPLIPYNGNCTDERDTPRGRKPKSTDSDNDEFCDSMEDLAVEERLSAPESQSPGLGAVSARHTDLRCESNTIPTQGEDQVLIGESYRKEGISLSKFDSYLSRRVRDSQTSRVSCMSQNIDRIDAQKKHMDEQIATALLQLRQDMNNVLDRLHTLELMTRSQLQSSPQGQECLLSFVQKVCRPPWWPFEVSPFTAVLTAFWPVIAFWLIELYHQRKKQKKNPMK